MNYNLGRCIMWNASLKIFSALFVALLLSACVTTQATRFVDVDLPPVAPKDVVIFETLDDIPTEYVKVGYIYMQGSSTFTDEAQMMEAARKKAGSMGANGVVMREVKEASQGEKIAAAVFGWGTQRRGKVLAVYFDKGNSSSLVFEQDEPHQSTSRELKRNVISDEEILLQEPETQFPNFRRAVKSAEKYSDAEIIELFRKKFPKMQSRSDAELIQLIENKYRDR